MSQRQLSVREPLAADAEQQALAEGLASESIEITPDWWAKRRERIASIAPESAS